MPQSNSRAIWALLLVQFVGALGFTITLPLMPYYAATFDAGPMGVSLISAVYALCALVAGPVLGRLSDRQGRRPWLLFSQIGTLIGFIVTAFGGALWVIFLGRIIDGISGGNQVIAQAYVGDVTEPEQRTRVYGLMGAAFGLGAIVGPLIGGGLSQFGYATPFWVAAAISALTIVTTFFLLPESRQAEQPIPRATSPISEFTRLLDDRSLRGLLALYGVMALIFGLFVASIGLFMQLRLGASPLVAGLMVAYYGVISVLVQVLLVGRVARRLGERSMAALGLIVLVGAMAALGLSNTIPTSLVGVTALVLGMSLLRPAATSLLSQSAGPDQQGAVMGATQSIQSLADLIAPLVGGVLIASGTPGAPFFAAALVALLGLLLRPDRTAPTPARAEIVEPSATPNM